MGKERIDPWSSEIISDYTHLYADFGLQKMNSGLTLDYKLFERNLILGHRDFQLIVKSIKEKKPFINITGIASSGNLHLGHKIDIELFAFFSKYTKYNYFTIADIDGFVSRPDERVKNMEEAKKFAVDNTAHLLAFGLTEKQIYVQSNYEKKYYEFAFELSKKITKNTFEAVYGHVDLGKVSAAILQYADILHPQLKEFSGVMPSITGIGLDQDPHARLARDIAKRLPYKMFMPSFVFFKHQSGLRDGSKMSSGHPDATIFLDDSYEEIKKKINKSFTGGKPTAEEQKKSGADIDICKVCELLSFHMNDTKELLGVLENEKKGRTLCGETKSFAIEFLTKELEKHQKKKAQSMTKAEKIVFG